MMSDQPNNHHARLPDPIVRQAIAWHIRLNSTSTAPEFAACEHWRQSDPSHEVAWQRLQRMDSTFDQAANSAGSLAHATLLQTNNDCQQISRRQALKTMAGSAFSICAIGWLAYDQGAVHRLRADYSTVSNQRNSYTLQDHSQLWLNSDSAVQLNFTSEKRTLELTRGEIHLTAAYDSRPLQVAVPQGLISATNDQFVVRNASDHSLLQVVSGRVVIEQPQTKITTVVQAGELYQFNHNEIKQLDSTMFDYSSWVDGIFSVRDMPLKQLLAELSHYRAGYVRCDSSLDNHLVSGVYQLHDTDLILQILARSTNAQVRYLSRWWAQIMPVATA